MPRIRIFVFVSILKIIIYSKQTQFNIIYNVTCQIRTGRFFRSSPSDGEVDEVMNEKFRTERIEIRGRNDFSENDHPKRTTRRSLEVVADLCTSKLNVSAQHFAQHQRFSKLKTKFLLIILYFIRFH